MTVGCSVHEFWYESPKLLWTYAKIYQQNKENELNLWQSKVNVETWLIGRYVLAAIGSCIDNSNKYPERPLEVFKTDCDESEKELPAMSESERQIRNQVQKAKDTLELMSSGKPKAIIGEERI